MNFHFELNSRKINQELRKFKKKLETMGRVLDNLNNKSIKRKKKKNPKDRQKDKNDNETMHVSKISENMVDKNLLVDMKLKAARKIRKKLIDYIYQN